jgi:hypothetical protein
MGEGEATGEGEMTNLANDKLFTCWGIECAGMIRGSFRAVMSAVCGLWKQPFGRSQSLPTANVGAATMRASTNCLTVLTNRGLCRWA